MMEAILAGLLLLVLGTVIRHFWKIYSFWSDRGIAGPPPLPLFGNSLTLMLRSVTDVDTEDRLKYGKVYGTYDGTLPVLVVSDPELAHQILIKNFSSIVNQFDCSSPYSFENENVLFSVEDEWRRHRSVINRSLTSSRVKKMCQQMDTSDLMHELRIREGQTVDLDALFKLHTINMTTQVLLGLDQDLFHDPKALDIVTASEYVFSSRIFLNFSFAKYWFISLLPFWLARALGLMQKVEWSSRLYRSLMSQFISKRIEKDIEREDMTQTLIQAMRSGSLTFDEVVSNAIIATGAAWGTMQPTICFLLYELARNPEQQRMIHEEVDALGDFVLPLPHESAASASKNVTLDQLSKLVRLEAALNETLRMHPTEGRGFRRVSSPDGFTIPGTDVTLPAGTAIHVATYVMHHNPEYWTDPEAFDFSRFLPENKDQIVRCSFMGFSAGPRSCPGQQMAMIMMKKTLVHILSEFSVSHPEPVHTFPANSIINLPYVSVRLNKRHRAAI